MATAAAAAPPANDVSSTSLARYIYEHCRPSDTSVMLACIAYLHCIIHLNCFYRIQGLIVDSIFFAVRVLRIWNSLPEDVVSAAHLSSFINRLVRVNLNQFLIGKM